MGSVFMMDSGSTVGTIDGHSKKILSCDFKQARPFQIRHRPLASVFVLFYR
jgi:hypothetical protein